MIEKSFAGTIAVLTSVLWDMCFTVLRIHFSEKPASTPYPSITTDVINTVEPMAIG